jgi:hypothetical protein
MHYSGAVGATSQILMQTDNTSAIGPDFVTDEEENNTGGSFVRYAGPAASPYGAAGGTISLFGHFITSFTSTIGTGVSLGGFNQPVFDLTNQALVSEVANASSGGTALQKLAKLGTTGAVTALTSDTSGIIGCVIEDPGTTGYAQIAVGGQGPCTFDNATTIGDYVQISSTVAGDVHDAGATRPTSGQIIGRSLTTFGSPGVENMLFYGPDQAPSSSAVTSSPQLENCVPDTSGFVGYSAAGLTNYQYGHWEYTFAQASAIYCTVFIPAAQTGATLVLDIAANDGTAGHTANFQTCDGVINSGTINIGALTCAANQAFTTTSTAYTRVTLTFNVQSTLSNNSILVVKIATSTTGTAPVANMLLFAHFIL